MNNTEDDKPGSLKRVVGHHVELETNMDKIKIARDAILAELYRRFHANDKAVKALDPDNAHRWYNPNEQKNCFNGAGEMDCPVCKTGKLRYSRASYNGHVHAGCTTKGCVSWME